MASARAILVLASSISLLACGGGTAPAARPTTSGPDPAGRLVQGLLKVPEAASVRLIAANGKRRLSASLASDGSFSIRLPAERGLYRIRFARFESGKATARGTLVTRGHRLFQIDGNIGLAVDLGSIRGAHENLSPPSQDACNEQGEKLLVENASLEQDRQVLQEDMCDDEDNDKDHHDLCDEDC
jgi:hypothetical protein